MLRDVLSYKVIYIKLTVNEYRQDRASGAVLEGFLRLPETTQSHDFPLTMGAPLFGYNISRGIHSGLNSSSQGRP